MKRTVSLMTCLALCCACWMNAGCSQPSEPTTNAASSSASATASAPQAAPAATTATATPAAPASPAVLFDTPDRAVAAFLKALRDGDDRVAESLLTPKAREETAKRSLAVQPPGTPAATFEIGQVEYLGADKNGAHVKSVWTERDEKRGSSSYDIVWALRRQNGGWLIAGMATQVTPTDPPVFLNFEDPDDMLEKWRAAEERLAAQNPEVRQAAKTETAPAPAPTTR